MKTPTAPSSIQKEIDALVSLAFQRWIDAKTLIWLLQKQVWNSAEAIIKIQPLIDMRSAQEIVLSDPKRKAAVDKLLTFIWKIEYQKERWRAALNVMTWMQKNVIDAWLMTEEELLLVPIFVFSDPNPRLHQALLNFERPFRR